MNQVNEYFSVFDKSRKPVLDLEMMSKRLIGILMLEYLNNYQLLLIIIQSLLNLTHNQHHNYCSHSHSSVGLFSSFISNNFRYIGDANRKK